MELLLNTGGLLVQRTEDAPGNIEFRNRFHCEPALVNISLLGEIRQFLDRHRVKVCRSGEGLTNEIYQEGALSLECRKCGWCQQGMRREVEECRSCGAPLAEIEATLSYPGLTLVTRKVAGRGYFLYNDGGADAPVHIYEGDADELIEFTTELDTVEDSLDRKESSGAWALVCIGALAVIGVLFAWLGPGWQPHRWWHYVLILLSAPAWALGAVALPLVPYCYFEQWRRRNRNAWIRRSGGAIVLAWLLAVYLLLQAPSVIIHGTLIE